VASHWVLDLIVHVPDLPLAGNDSPKLGLGLWRHPGLSVALELLVLGGGLAVYLTGRSRRHPVRTVRLAIVLLLLVVTYAASLMSPPPPSITAIGASDIGFILIMGALAAWADRAAAPRELMSAAHPVR
jgi:hypothetical protein